MLSKDCVAIDIIRSSRKEFRKQKCLHIDVKFCF